VVRGGLSSVAGGDGPGRTARDLELAREAGRDVSGAAPGADGSFGLAVDVADRAAVVVEGVRRSAGAARRLPCPVFAPPRGPQMRLSGQDHQATPVRSMGTVAIALEAGHGCVGRFVQEHRLHPRPAQDPCRNLDEAGSGKEAPQRPAEIRSDDDFQLRHCRDAPGSGHPPEQAARPSRVLLWKRPPWAAHSAGDGSW